MVMISSMMAVGCFTAAAQASVACGEMKSSAPSGAGDGQPGSDAGTLAVEDERGARFGGAGVAGLLHHEILHVRRVAVAGREPSLRHRPRTAGLRPAVIGGHDLRSEFGGGERRGRARGDLLESGGIRRERHQMGQDQQDALALRESRRWRMDR